MGGHLYFFNFDWFGTFSAFWGAGNIFNYWIVFQWVVVTGCIVSGALLLPDCFDFGCWAVPGSLLDLFRVIVPAIGLVSHGPKMMFFDLGACWAMGGW